MKPIKFIVFADAKTHCEMPGDNFLEQDLKLEYGTGQNETAIGLKIDSAEKVSAFDDSFEIYLFNDTFSIPNDDSIFFKSFLQDFYLNREKNSYKVILHRSSKWNFNSFDLKSDSFYSPFAIELKWLQSLKENESWIYQSHTSTDVYCRELKEIAKAILEKNKNDYEKTLRRLNGRFMDKQLEDLLKPFEKIVPLVSGNESQDLMITNAKIKLKTYLQLP